MYVVTVMNKGISVEVHNLKEKLLSGSVVQGINSIDSFSFTISPANVGFNLLNNMKTVVSVYNTNKRKYEFYGRVLYTSAEMTESGMITKSVVCESVLGYLCDSVQAYEPGKTWNTEALFGHIISAHNAQLESGKRFVVRDILKRDVTCEIERENTWETIKKKLIDTIGGEIQYEVADDAIYIDYKYSLGETKKTAIRLSENMKAITRERNPSDIVTRLIPLGAKTSDKGEERVTVAFENGGKEYINNDEAIELYGIRVGYMTWDDVTDPKVLLTKGEQWLAANAKTLVKYSITALDLSPLGLAIDDFEVHNTYPIENPLLGIEDKARVVKKVIDICTETKSTIEVGDKFKSAAEIQRDRERELVYTFKTVQNINGSYVSKTDYDQIVDMMNNSTKPVAISGDRMSVESSYFGLTKDGVITAKSGTVAGFKFDELGLKKKETNSYLDDGDMYITETKLFHVAPGYLKASHKKQSSFLVKEKEVKIYDGLLYIKRDDTISDAFQEDLSFMTIVLGGAEYNLFIDPGNLSVVVKKKEETEEGT